MAVDSCANYYYWSLALARPAHLCYKSHPQIPGRQHPADHKSVAVEAGQGVEDAGSCQGDIVAGTDRM